MNNFICERRVYKNTMVKHSHVYAQLIIPLHGILSIKTNNRNLELDDKNIFFLPPDCGHTFKACNTNEFLVLDIPNYMLSNEGNSKLKEEIQYSLDEKWKAIRFLILSELDSSNKGQGLTRLFHYFYPMILNKKTSASIQYINEHFNEDIDFKMLANIEHYNVSYYSEWFKKVNKVSPIEYIKKLRIEKAKELLTNTDFNIARIALEVGYSHHSSLTRVFKEYEKISPANFRLENRKLDKE
ncbi:AraC family transcriptional regulator [Clostridium thailandense]|uniref:Helix-turn-helix domain-containing protein n=1 Tax=Clostridium thailandense TaxID=2794346 RepID=A0A949TSW2_9CLOT|nr:AraC family transcriptional regulator [Clostridium thailandense]MBV7274752.1 helix-turn-helix domain-containing protein [Clostridium thailandense]